MKLIRQARPLLQRCAGVPVLRWPLRQNLTFLARLFQTDKWGVHRYTPHYQRHFKPFRNRRINLLEIGVGGWEDPRRGGKSLRMWKAFFPRGRVFAIDVFDKAPLQEYRITIFRGSQNDPEFLTWVADRIGRIDLIVDDGSHINEHVLTAFQTLFPRLAAGGIYAIEDLQTSYWPEFGGSNDPDATKTSMAMLKRLVDGVNWEEFRNREPAPFDRHIKGLHFYHNLAFVHKGCNEEGTTRDQTHRVERTPALASSAH